MEYFPIIGLEIHIELKTRTKMFCSCLNNPEEKHPNLNICPICLGHPGVLPVINQEAVRKVLKLGLALNADIAEIARFDRKNYFYPDLPKGYQISQYEEPLCKGGYLEIPLKENFTTFPSFKKIRIRRIHLEEDTARLLHSDDGTFSLVDFNRAGIPLLELVTEPDLNSGWEAKRFCEELQNLLHYLEISEANMEKGEMRCEVNISLKKENQENLGTKVEIKNLNSFRAVEEAINYEIERQSRVLKKGKKIIQETRGWDEIKRETVSQREKEEAEDYRYFPEPDLKPLKISQLFDLEELKREIPELPKEKRWRFIKEFGLNFFEADNLVFDPLGAIYFEKVVSELDGLQVKNGQDREKRIKLAYNYFFTDLRGLMIKEKINFNQLKITPHQFAHLVNLLDQEKISSAAGKAVLAEAFYRGVDPEAIIQEKNLFQIFDEKQLDQIIEQIIIRNEKAVQDFLAGKENALQFLVGEAMRETQGRANPQVLQKRLRYFLTNIKK